MRDANGTSFRFAVIADSHFHLEGHDPQAHYPSDGRHNEQNRQVVHRLNEADIAFVIHLGDVPHPVPGTAAHLGALQIASETYSPLKVPLFMVPGNHDVGDKPQGWATAPKATRARHQDFIQRWGPPFGSFDEGNIHVVWIDSPILNTDSEMEAEQRQWLEQDLANAQTNGQRIFAFIHYPPFLCSPTEAEHYDNLAEPARHWLLDQLADHQVEALFCGHVHHFFWNRYREMDIYLVPATSFIRPEYSELCTIAPGAENGRDDQEKLGFFFVHVDDNGHHIELARSIELPQQRAAPLAWGQAPHPDGKLGVSLRHDWMRPRTLPAGNLDEFRRKLARFDLPLLALWEAGCRHIRIPTGDLDRSGSRARLKELHQRGMNITVYSAGQAALQHAEAVTQEASWLAAWEIITLDGSLPDHPALQHARQAGVPIFASCIQQKKDPTGQLYFSHFPRHGFPADHSGFPEILAGKHIDGLTGVIPFDAHPWGALAFDQIARTQRCPVHVHIELRRDEEGRRHVDDHATARQVAEAVLTAHQAQHIRLFLEPFVDHDRGYFPRNGLLDRRGSPRPAHRVWCHLQRLLRPGTIRLIGDEPRVFDTPSGHLYLNALDVPSEIAPDAVLIDLVTGQPNRPTTPTPVLLWTPSAKETEPKTPH